jgi:hypothetical protein
MAIFGHDGIYPEAWAIIMIICTIIGGALALLDVLITLMFT